MCAIYKIKIVLKDKLKKKNVINENRIKFKYNYY